MSTSLTFDILARDRASDKFDNVGRSASGSADKLKKFAKVGALAVAAGAVIAGKALFDMTKAAMEDEKAQQVLATSMKNAAGANKGQVAQVEKWISAQGKAKGIADDELRPAMSRLVQATGDVHKSQKLAGLAMDVSAGTGKSLKSVTDALAKAQTGSLGGLSKMGVATKNADGSTKSLKQVTEELAKVHQGQSSKAAETTEGKFKRLKVMFDETKETIGAKLIPVAGKLADWFLTKVMPAAQKLGDWLREKLGPPLKDLAEKVGPMATKIMDALKDAFKDAKPYIELMGKIMANVVVPAMKKLLEVAGPVLAGQIKLMGKMLRFVGEAGTWMWNNALQPAFKFLTKGISVVLSGFESMLGAMSKVPGFGWAKDAATAMGKAADKALAISNNLKKIPPTKKVYVSVVTKYTNLNSPTRGSGGGINPEDYLGRGVTKATLASIGSDLMEAIGQGIKKGGKKLDKVLESSRDTIKNKLGQIRDDMTSMSASIASALQPDAFSFSNILQVLDDVTGAVTTAGQTAMQQSMAQLSGTNSALTNLLSVFGGLQSSVSKGFLASLMQSGNTDLIQQYAADPAAAAQASALYDSNAQMAGSLGDQTATAVLGDKIATALQVEMKALADRLEDAPGKTAKKLAKELEGLVLEVTGLDAGKKANLRGAWG